MSNNRVKSNQMMTLYTTVITLILVMDPLGNIPVFLSMLSHVNPKRRRLIIFREAVIAYFILLFFLLFGQHILQSMNISQPALAIAGGIILFLISIRMIFPDHSQDDRTKPSFEPFIVPLAIPLIAGPSTMAMVMLLASQAPYNMPQWIAALTVAWLVTAIILLFAGVLSNMLGERGLIAIEKLMGMILTTMAVQMFLTGFEQFLHA